jgi:hypothetical protein
MFSERRALWIYEQYTWLEVNLPRRSVPQPRVLVMPTNEFFPEKYSPTESSATLVFDRIRNLMGIGAWNCALVQKGSPQAALRNALSDGGIRGFSSPSDPVGTFSTREKVTITYAKELLAEPLALVAILAHELGHYLLAACVERPACSKEDQEPLTDLTAVFEGFGLFSCHAAFQFKQWTGTFTQGWEYKQCGYLSEAEFAFGLGVFCVRNGVEVRLAAKYLQPNPRQVFLDSIDFIRDLDNKRMHNQSPDPTPLIVMPPAGQESFRF